MDRDIIQHMISKEEVKKLADLARIKLTENEVEKLQADMGRILDYVGQIQEVKGERLEVESLPENKNIMREDGEPHERGIWTEKLLAQAPKRKGGWVEVKKILEAGR